MQKFYIILISFIILINNECESVKFKRAAVGPTWPSRTIPYVFSNRVDFDLDDRSTIEHILYLTQTMLQSNGDYCIEFKPRDNEPDYILFIDNGDCSSSVGYSKGINRISLHKKCITTEVVMHELMHRLGFDHEHSRHDRDKHISINFDNIDKKNDFNFEINRKLMQNNEFEMSPYDFFSITHYNSDALQKSKQLPTILSKIPALISKDNQIEIERRYLSNIDIIQVQTLYNCRKLPMPNISKQVTSEDADHRVKQSKRFQIEAKFLGVNDSLIERYLNKTYDTCGMNHFWPADYPLVESDHKHYQLNCVSKKKNFERCLFSLECSNDETVCNRPFFKKRGWCIDIGNNDLNKLNQLINDGLFEAGKIVKDKLKDINGTVVKDKLVETGLKLKDKWNNFDGKKFQNDFVQESVVIKDKLVDNSKKLFKNIQEASKEIKDSFLKIFGY